MFQLGQIAVKVACMFQLQPTDTPPAEACKAAAAWLIGLESGDAAVYADCDAEALRQHGRWVASRNLQVHFPTQMKRCSGTDLVARKVDSAAGRERWLQNM